MVKAGLRWEPGEDGEPWVMAASRFSVKPVQVCLNTNSLLRMQL